MTHCNSSNPSDKNTTAGIKQIAVLGMPNTGKSTFFNRFTGANASVGNWPGITVDLMMAKIKIDDQEVQVVDLPGIYDLRGFSEDEAVVRRFFEITPIHLVIIILNATQIDRQISLALQVKHLQLSAVLLLNMADEAPKFGVSIDHDKASEHLGMPVVPISAKYGQGYSQAYKTIQEELAKGNEPFSVGKVEDNFAPEQQIALEMETLLQNAVHTSTEVKKNLTSRLDKILLHPVLGLPIFFGAMYLIFQFIYMLGTPLQDYLGNALTWFKDNALEPVLAGFSYQGVWGKFFHDFLINGIYEGIGTVATFLPMIFLFFICMAILEDSGYLSRSAYLMDALMERLGLDGRSFVMSLMGFGCNVPAIMGLRVMRSPALRLLSMLVIPFSLCSARLNVFIFMTTAIFTPQQATKVLFSLYIFSFTAAILTAILFQNKYPNQEPFLLELPPYRFPTFKHMIMRAWREVMHFMVWSRRFIIFGVVVIWFCNNFPTNVLPASPQTISGMIGQFTQPILQPLGINPQLAVALIFGFVAKEIVLGGLAVIYSTQNDAGLAKAISQQIDWVQAYSFMLFTLLYVPCISTITVIKTESKSAKFAWITVVWSVGLAWITSFIFYQSARALGF
ncbi:ferrous iron transport protein B [Nostoc sp. DedSLP04]|uniref:ferrous iron transport protein B n=1 Tax=Nostoc sp. DedSLP04 TaxID=3075401 RepID=UPI002AD27259|nr:ferrous iron transport protein B [Nostoc sp. DedSLP04]MDZ8034200.1 ferrous iron transport protein B [Nostoc sp. DedSLP04]